MNVNIKKKKNGVHSNVNKIDYIFSVVQHLAMFKFFWFTKIKFSCVQGAGTIKIQISAIMSVILEQEHSLVASHFQVPQTVRFSC